MLLAKHPEYSELRGPLANLNAVRCDALERKTLAAFGVSASEITQQERSDVSTVTALFCLIRLKKNSVATLQNVSRN